MMNRNNQFVNHNLIQSKNNLEAELRLDSSKLVDLHIYILPRNFWITKQNLAYNDTILESVSAGFIRVTKDLQLANLRNEIRRQCSIDEVPKDYVFLRSVGRALTRVKPNQEYELKVKNFLPPQSLGPEIFLLEYDKEINQNLLKKFDSISNINRKNDDNDSDDYYYHNFSTNNLKSDKKSLPEIYNPKLSRPDYQNGFNSYDKPDNLNNKFITSYGPPSRF